MSAVAGARAHLVRDLVLLGVVGVLLIAALAAGAGALYREFYSPSAFVLRYLSLLEQGRAADALAVPGVALDSSELADAGLPQTASEALLRRAALTSLSDVEVVSETTDGTDTDVAVRFVAGGHAGEVTFAVASVDSAGPLPMWRFARSPLAVIDLHISGSMVFEVNGFTVDKRQVSIDGAETDPDASFPLLVFSPGLYAVSVDTALAHADGTAVISNAPMKQVPVSIAAQPTAEFTDLVQQRVTEFLTACATQQVLQPTGCPFGYVVDNRVEQLPQWSITQQPQITLLPSGAGWRIPDTEAVAHIEVGVRSLYDGTLRQVSEDVPFSVNASVDLTADGTASIRIGGDVRPPGDVRAPGDVAPPGSAPPG